jgi:hypothetical protein
MVDSSGNEVSPLVRYSDGGAGSEVFSGELGWQSLDDPFQNSLVLAEY